MNTTYLQQTTLTMAIALWFACLISISSVLYNTHNLNPYDLSFSKVQQQPSNASKTGA